MQSYSRQDLLFFYASAPQPCPYLPGRMERRLIADLSRRDAVSVHERLSKAGFRRSHTLAYCPVCSGCNACAAVRVPVGDFRASRTQRKLWQRNRGLTVTCGLPIATAEQYRLFRSYQLQRHAESDMAKMEFADYQALVEESPVETVLVEVRDPEGVLLAGCLADRLSDGLSAVYSFYDARSRYKSLGVFMILWLIEQVRREGRAFVYLGYWIPNSQKMAYKALFNPLEIYSPEGWRRLRDGLATDGPAVQGPALQGTGDR